MAGGLQFSALEILHHLSHVKDMLKGSFEQHHFHSHQGDHQHQLLSAIGIYELDHSNNPPPSGERVDLTIFKFPQLLVSPKYSIINLTETPPFASSVSRFPNCIYLTILTPPPQF